MQDLLLKGTISFLFLFLFACGPEEGCCVSHYFEFEEHEVLVKIDTVLFKPSSNSDDNSVTFIKFKRVKPVNFIFNKKKKISPPEYYRLSGNDFYNCADSINIAGLKDSRKTYLLNYEIRSEGYGDGVDDPQMDTYIDYLSLKHYLGM